MKSEIVIPMQAGIHSYVSPGLSVDSSLKLE